MLQIYGTLSSRANRCLWMLGLISPPYRRSSVGWTFVSHDRPVATCAWRVQRDRGVLVPFLIFAGLATGGPYR